MHRGIYKTYTVENGYIRDKRTGENLGKTVELYCYTADEHNIYYDEPHIDYPDNYEHIVDNKIISIADELKAQGFYKIPHAIISNHKRISSIEPFHIDECNNFYSIPIDPSVKDLLLGFGLENLKVNKNLFQLLLNKYQDAGKHGKAYLIFFFIESDDEEINYQLNQMRLHIISDNLRVTCAKKLADGIFITINDKILKVGCSQEDLFNLAQAKSEEGLPLVNSYGKYMLSKSNLALVENALNEKKNKLDAYAQAYLEFVASVLTPNFKFSEYTGDNFLLFGYTNDQIIEREAELLCSL